MSHLFDCLSTARFHYRVESSSRSFCLVPYFLDIDIEGELVVYSYFQKLQIPIGRFHLPSLRFLFYFLSSLFLGFIFASHLLHRSTIFSKCRQSFSITRRFRGDCDDYTECSIISEFCHQSRVFKHTLMLKLKLFSFISPTDEMVSASWGVAEQRLAYGA